MAYKAIKLFTDGKDGGYQYNPGDEYPRKGYTPNPGRIAELLSDQNKRGEPMIAEVKEPEEVKKAEKVSPKSEPKSKPDKKKPKKK